MDRNAQKVFLAVALGVGLGILVGRAIGGPIAWLLGALIGGAFAYVLFAPIAAIRAIPAAYRAAAGWRLTAEEWEEVRWTLYALLAPFTSMLAIIFTISWFFEEDTRMTSTPFGWLGLGLCSTAVGLIVGICFVSSNETSYPFEVQSGRLWLRRKLATHLLLPVLLFWHFPLALWWIATVAIPAIAVFAVRLGKQWLILIHSDLRMICLVDAFLFAGIGTLTGGPILAWMVGGGAFGVLNYRIVSIRWLKLKPIAAR